MNKDELRASIVPKSDQLNADDMLAGPIVVTIQNVRRGAKDQPVVVDIDGGHQPYKPCKSMRRVMIAAWGDEAKDWHGQSMRLYNDPSIKFGGVKVGGIRISHMTGLNGRMSLMLTTTRSRRAEFIVEPLEVDYYDPAKFEAAFESMADAVQSGKMTTEQVIAKCQKTGRLTQEQIDRINQLGATNNG
jgi:hypothetical protein